jgi:hypothetical protein
MILAADMAGAMREASGRLEELEMERDAAQRAQATAGDDDSVQPFMSCPRCAAEYPDFDGVGVLYCPRCGFCKHASRSLGPDGWVCGFCGDVEQDREVEHDVVLPRRGA